MYGRAQSNTAYRGSATIEVEEILVERITLELDGDDFFDGGVRNPQCLLQTLEDALAVLVRIL